jgi:hypothetical protein
MGRALQIFCERTIQVFMMGAPSPPPPPPGPGDIVALSVSPRLGPPEFTVTLMRANRGRGARKGG